MFDYLSRYFTLFSYLAAFTGGWYGGYTYYNVSQLKIDLNASNQEVKTKDRLLTTTNQNIDNITKQSIILKNQKDTIQGKLDQQIKDNSNAKNYINANNIITRDLLQRVGALKTENTKLRKNSAIASGTITTNGSISAYDYVQWAAGLKAHDDACVMSFNGLQSFYNKQRILNNGFK